MNLRPRQHEQPDINLTPLIDVVFLLLIFFMVTTTFRSEADFRVELPEASAGAEPDGSQRLEVIIDADGRYRIAGEVLPDGNIETLQRALDAAAPGPRRPPLVIQADARTPHQAVVTVMDAAGQLGFRDLGIATVRGTEP